MKMPAVTVFNYFSIDADDAENSSTNHPSLSAVRYSIKEHQVKTFKGKKSDIQA